MLYEMTIPNFTKGLKNLDAILDKGAGFADSKKVEVGVLLNSRLAPDQFPLARQVQIVCDTVKLGVSRLTGKDAPVHDDAQNTLPQLKSRIQEVIGYLEGFSKKDFEGTEVRKITTPRWNGQHLTGTDYIHHHVLPNFYFHITTAYSILRHNGVEIGKKDYLGPMPFKN